MKINAEIHDRTILLWLECASDVKMQMSFVSEIRMNTRFSVFPHPQSGAVYIKKKPDSRTPDRLKEILKPANGWNSIHLTTATVLRIPPILFLAAALASSPIAIFLP